MRLIALELDNFRQYAHAQIAFEPGITAIVGANGSGKTTLVEAILWALYGARVVREGADTLRFLWSQGGAKVRVVLEFELGNRRYRIRRTPTEAELAQLNPDGTWLPIARGTSAVNDQVQRLLGMNHLQFQTSFCARQKELEFMAYKPEKRREEISRMLGYERITDALERATLTARALQAEVDGLRQSIGDPQHLQAELQAAEDALQRTESDLEAEEARLEQAVDTYTRAKHAYDAQATLREQYLELDRQRALLQKDYQHNEARIEELRTAWENLKNAQERFKQIEPQVQRYHELRDLLKRLDDLAHAEQQRARLQAQYDQKLQQRYQLQQERAQLLEKQHTLDALRPVLAESEQLTEALKRVRASAQQAAQRSKLETQLQNLQQQLMDLRVLSAQQSKLQDEIQMTQQALQTHEQHIAQLERQHDVLFEQWNQQRIQTEAELRAAEHTLHQHQARIRELESLGAESTCPTCGQPLGDAYHEVLQQARADAAKTEQHLLRLRQHLQSLQTEPEALHQLRNTLEQAYTQRDAYHQQLAQQRAQLHALEQQLQQVPSIERQIRQLETQLKRIPIYDPAEEQRLQAAIEQLQPQVEQARQLEVELRRLPIVERDLAQVERQCADLEAQIRALPTGYDAAQHQAARAEAEQLYPIYEEYTALKPVLQQRKQLLEQIEEAKQKRAALSAELNALNTQLEQLGYSEEAYLQAHRDYEQAEQQMRAIQEAVHELRTRRAEQRATRDELKRQLERIDELKQQLEAKERDLLLHQTVRRALQDFRTELNTRLRPTLAAIATEFLSTLTNGRYTELDIDEEYRFTVIDEGHRKAVISGGEEDIVNLSLRLALARMITERAGHPLSLLILDEVFASLDAERRQSVMELLNNLRTWFDQILVISHFEEINEAADRCLRVQRNPATRASEIIEPDLPTAMQLGADGLAE